MARGIAYRGRACAQRNSAHQPLYPIRAGSGVDKVGYFAITPVQKRYPCATPKGSSIVSPTVAKVDPLGRSPPISSRLPSARSTSA